jgi:hypothetical protein
MYFRYRWPKYILLVYCTFESAVGSLDSCALHHESFPLIHQITPLNLRSNEFLERHFTVVRVRSPAGFKIYISNRYSYMIKFPWAVGRSEVQTRSKS